MAIQDYWSEPRSSEWARIPRMLSKDVDLDLLWCISSFKHWNFKRFAQVSLKALKKVLRPHTTIPSFSASLSSWTSWLFGQRFAPQFLRGSSILGARASLVVTIILTTWGATPRCPEPLVELAALELNSCDVKGFVNSDEFNQCGIEEGIITQQLFDLLLEHTVHGLANLVQDPRGRCRSEKNRQSGGSPVPMHPFVLGYKPGRTRTNKAELRRPVSKPL